VTLRVDQSEARAEGDIAGRDVNKTINNFAAPREATVVEQLLVRLNAEIEQNQQVRSTIERLQRFYERRAHDGVVGLQAKLEVAGREGEYEDAIEMKEMFVKLLERWSLYHSAQHIFAHLLARAEVTFKSVILPRVGADSDVVINQMVLERIVEPTVGECGASVFEVDHMTAMGMIYWLAEQCFVRWHH
jgi:hypothetical protein